MCHAESQETCLEQNVNGRRAYAAQNGVCTPACPLVFPVHSIENRQLIFGE